MNDKDNLKRMASAPDSAEQDRKNRNFNRKVQFKGYQTSNFVGAPRTALPGDTAEKRRNEAKKAAISKASDAAYRKMVKNETTKDKFAGKRVGSEAGDPQINRRGDTAEQNRMMGKRK